MKPLRSLGACFAVAAVALALTAPGARTADAHARPGGGQGFSRPSSPSRPASPPVVRVGPPSSLSPHTTTTTATTGDGGVVAPEVPGSTPSSEGGGGGAFAVLLILVALGAFVYFVTRPSRGRPPEEGLRAGVAVPDARGVSARATLARLRDIDPTFSLVLFEDYFYALYAEVQRRHAAGEIDLMSAFLGGDVLARMKAQPRNPVSGVVIGGMHYESAWISGSGPDARVTVDVNVEANLTVETARGPASEYRVERWTLLRKAGATSRSAEKARTFDCPNCGAPQSAVMAGHCTHCNQTVSTGDFGWVVEIAVVVEAEPQPPLLTTEVEETGNELPTIVDDQGPERLVALSERDESFAWAAFEQRVGLIWSEFQVAWSSRDLAKMRPFLSDNLFQMQEYWVRAYEAQHLRNVTENGRIERIELARVESDAAFDAITVRLWGASLDYTVKDDGSVVVGSTSQERRYSEYWTLIRGAHRKGPARSELVCPNCGAPLDINMVGVCTFCQAKVTTGEFDWVLSRIEQDEAYTG